MGGGWRGAGSSCVIHSEGGRRDVVVSLVLREEAMEVLVRREGGVHLTNIFNFEFSPFFT